MKVEPRPDLDCLFDPRSIAVVGASSNADKVAGLPVRFLKELGFAGRIFPVNPSSREVQGLPCYPRVAAIDEPIDLAILSVPANATADVLDECGRAGVRSALLFSSGFAETGEEGGRAQAHLSSIARSHGMRLLGPNCLGLMNIHSGAYATFSPVLLSGPPQRGSVAIVSQSGAFGIFALVRARERRIGVSLFVSTGNEMDIDLADCIAYLADDPQTKVIACYMEGARDGAKLMAALELARRNRKAVVICKSGASAMGTQAAASHTAALAGRDEVFDAVFKQCGAYRARDVDELFDVAYACSVSPLPRSRRMGILTMSGGAGVSLADAAEHHRMQVPELSPDIKARILARVPHASVSGPVDLTGRTLDDPTLFSDAVDWCVGSGIYDSVISFQAVTGITPQHRHIITETWSTVRAKHPDLPVAVVSVFDDQNRRFLDQSHCLAFEEPFRAVRALAALAGFCEAFERPVPALIDISDMPLADDRIVSEADALALLARAGIPVVAHKVAKEARDAGLAAQALGFPVAIKVLSPDIAHKSDVGGVALGLRSREDAEKAFHAVLGRAREAKPAATLDGVLVAPMVSGGVECILGGLVDPIFGPMVMFGLGGVLVEVLHDVSFRRAPIDSAEAHRMIREIRCFAVLEGVRGRPATDIDALAAALVRLSRLIAANVDGVASIEINPFIVLEQEHGGFAVDALVIPALQTRGD